MKTSVSTIVLLSTAMIALPTFAERDSSISGKTVEIATEDQATAIIQTGNGRVIGKTGELLKQLTPSKPSVNYRNSSISAGENLTIKATGQGTIIVQTGDGTIIYEANKDAVEKVGVAESSLASFFAILQVEDVPIADWEIKLTEIGKSFRELKAKLAEIQTSDKAIIALKDQANEAIDLGQFEQARKLLDQAEQKAMDSYVENRLLTAAEIAASKGALANTLLKYLEMGEEYESAADKIGALGDKYHEKRSEYLDGAGSGYEEAGLYKRSEPFLEKALALREKHLAAEHNDVGTSLNNLANLYSRQGRYEDAEPLYQRSLAIIEKALGKDHASVATTLNNLALLYESQGRYEDAEPLYQRSLIIKEKALGKDHPSVASTLNNLAELYRQQGRYEDAEPLYQRSLIIKEKALGKDHPSVATTLNNLALLYESQGRYENAELLYQRDLAISEKALGKDHPSVATTLNNLGMLSYRQGNLVKASQYLEQALTILKKTFGDEHPNVKAMQGNLEFVKQKISQ